MNDKISAPFLSCIVPVYNTADYLAECLDSILLVPIPLEIIIVNDGSTDNSAEIIKKYCACYPYIKVIEQPNSGLSVARNKGFEAAAGEYVLFVDSDDTVSPQGVVNMADIARTYLPDIVLGKVESFLENGESKIWKSLVSPIGETPVSREYILKHMMADGFVPMVFDYMCRRDYIGSHGLRFMPGILHEDELWTPIVLSEAESVCISDMTHYRYHQRSGSIMDSSSCERRFFSIASIAHHLIDKILGHQQLTYPDDGHTVSFLCWRTSLLVQILQTLDFPSGGFLVAQLIGRMNILSSSQNSDIDKTATLYLSRYLDRVRDSDKTLC